MTLQRLWDAFTGVVSRSQPAKPGPPSKVSSTREVHGDTGRSYRQPKRIHAMARRGRKRQSPEERAAAQLHENRVGLYQDMMKRGTQITRKDLEEWEDLAASDPTHPLSVAMFVASQECRSIMTSRGSRQRMEMQLAMERNRDNRTAIQGWG